MKIYHYIVALIIVSALAAFYGFFLSDLKTNYDGIVNVTHLNVTRFSGYDFRNETSDYYAYAKNESEVPTGEETEFDIGIAKRFQNTWRDFGNSFSNIKNMITQAEKDFSIPTMLTWAFITIIGLIIAVKMFLGWLLDK